MSVAIAGLIQATFRRPVLLASLGKAPWAVVDQMVISATNFITIILLARGFSQASLGSFTLVYSALLFVNSIQAGLVTQPHNILGATRRGEDYARYTTSTALSQLVLAAGAALLALAAWTLARAAAWDDAALLLALAPAIVGWQSQEFVRRVLYTEGRLGAALSNDLLSYGGQAVTIAALWWQSALTGVMAFWVIAATFALGAVLGAWQIRSALTTRIDLSAVRENWHFGKWIAGGEIFGHWLSAQLFVYVAAAILGRSAAGILRAVHTVFGPSRVLAEVFCTMLPIRFARTLADAGKGELHLQLKRAYLAAVPLLGGYCLVVAVAAYPILWILYGDKYLDATSVMALYAASAFVSYMTMIVAAALRATRLTRQVFMSQLYASLIAFPIGWLMVYPFGIHGTVIGMMATHAVMLLLFFRAYRRQGQEDAASVSAPLAAPTDPLQERDPLSGRPEHIAGPGLMMMRIFQLLDEAGIPYCVLHGYASYPQAIRSDVDCMIPGDVLPERLAKLLHENRTRTGAQIVQWIHEQTHWVVLAGRNPDGSVCFLQLDISPRYELADRVFYSAEEVLQGRRRHNGFWVPAPSTEFGCQMVRRIIKGSLRSEQERELRELYQQDPAACHRQLRRFWPAESADAIASAVGSGDFAQIRASRRQLRRQLLMASARRHPVTTVATWTMRNLRRVGRWAWPRHGLGVVVLGPDGAGKSSVVRAVRQDMASAFLTTTCRSFPPALLNRGGGGAVNARPHDVAPRSWLNSAARAVLYWFVYHTVGHWFTVRKELARITLVMHDRHLLDSLVDPRRYRYGGPRGLLRWICRLIPRPEVVVLLDAPAEAIQQRKQELPVEETARQREEYWRLVSGLAGGHVVDAAQPLGQVVAEVDDLLVRHLARRAALRLGLEAPGRHQPRVIQVLRQLLGPAAADECVIELLGRGDQADVFIARGLDGRPVYRDYAEVVIKLYRSSTAGGVFLAQQEYESLTRLHALLDGRKLHGWTIRCPRPLYRSHRPLALVMTRVPGRSFNSLLNRAEAAREVRSAGRTAILAMRQYWAAETRVYGDLDFNNILCDLNTRTLSFVDPGMPEATYLCPEVSRAWFPASRDLAYMLFDVATSLRACITNPRIRERQKQFVEANLRAFVGPIRSAAERRRLLDEIGACAQVHMRRISLSWSPAGLFRLIVRQSASRCVRDVLGRLEASVRHDRPRRATREGI